MIMRLSPARLQGTLRAPDSKSVAHRHLICAALADQPSTLELRDISDDILATIRCLCALGSTIREGNGSLLIRPVWHNLPDCVALDCGESGSTLRFMLPIAAALGVKARFTGAGRLPERPNTPLIEQLRKHGVHVDRELLPIEIEGRLQAGGYELPGNVSSQYITGFLLALPHLDGPSQIELTSPLESSGYVGLTLSILKEHGYRIAGDTGAYSIPMNQRGTGGSFAVEGDWSNAAFWLAANALGHKIEITNLSDSSCQGDRAILPILEQLTKEDDCDIDAADIPDLVPILAVAATQAHGTARIRNAGRLRIKESDRISAMRENLQALGADIQETCDGLIIHGPTPLRGGKVDAYNDHRIAMSMAVAATVADGDVQISGAESVAKSYPGFFSDYRALCGIATPQE